MMEKRRVKSADIRDLKARKRALLKEMEEARAGIEDSLKGVRESVAGRTRFRYWVDKYPLHVLGSALLAGFFIARKTNNNKSRSGFSSRGVFYGIFVDELKKMAAQRAVKYLIHRMEEAMDDRNRKEE